MADYSYLGSGKVYMRVAGAAEPLAELGNCSVLNFSVTENTIELRDFTNVGGGTYNEVRRVDSVEVSVTAHDLSSANLRKALFGTSTTTASGSVTDEAATAYAEGFIPTVSPIDKTQTVTVTDSGAVTTYVDGTDYEVRDGGIYILSGTNITEGESILITYTGVAFDLVQALTQAAQEYEMVFEGLNEARSGKPVVVQAFRVKLGAAQNVSLIGEDYAALELTGNVLQDSTKGAGLSKYFTTKIAE